LKVLDERRRLSLMLDYEFGRGTGAALPRDGLEYLYSRRSDRLKQVTHGGKIFAVVRPNGAVALSLYGARLLSSSRAFMQNSVTVSGDAARFAGEGRSVFCKFVVKTGRHVLPGGEVAVVDEGGGVIAVGRAKLPGACMREFKAGVAVKVRSARE